MIKHTRRCFLGKQTKAPCVWCCWIQDFLGIHHAIFLCKEKGLKSNQLAYYVSFILLNIKNFILDIQPYLPKFRITHLKLKENNICYLNFGIHHSSYLRPIPFVPTFYGFLIKYKLLVSYNGYKEDYITTHIKQRSKTTKCKCASSN